jgi:multidrug transporter EmrE-like cation transporter
MSLAQITGLSLIEIVGDTGAKLFANNGGILNLGIGVFGYIGVFIMLIVSLQGSTLMMVNGAWDGISGLLNTIYSYFILGERFDDISQYFGLFLIIAGIYLLKVPLSKATPFKWPSF